MSLFKFGFCHVQPKTISNNTITQYLIQDGGTISSHNLSLILHKWEQRPLDITSKHTYKQSAYYYKHYFKMDPTALMPYTSSVQVFWSCH